MYIYKLKIKTKHTVTTSANMAAAPTKQNIPLNLFQQEEEKQNRNKREGSKKEKREKRRKEKYTCKGAKN